MQIMKEFIIKWCEKNGYIEIDFSSDNCYCKVNFSNIKFFILLK